MFSRFIDWILLPANCRLSLYLTLARASTYSLLDHNGVYCILKEVIGIDITPSKWRIHPSGFDETAVSSLRNTIYRAPIRAFKNPEKLSLGAWMTPSRFFSRWSLIFVASFCLTFQNAGIWYAYSNFSYSRFALPRFLQRIWSKYAMGVEDNFYIMGTLWTRRMHTTPREELRHSTK
jgi:hypothetical protein